MVQLTLFFFSVFLPFLMLINKYGFYSNVHVKSKWFGVVHHVTGEHEWGNGQCSHGLLTPSEEGNTFLAKRFKVC